MAVGRRARRGFDVWPGFVDALAALLMVVVFMVMVFALAQYFLGNALSGREQALLRLGRELASLTEQLSLERASNQNLRADLSRLSEQLRSSVAARDSLEAALADEKQMSSEARSQADLLNNQIAAMREELARIAAALEISEKESAAQKVQIADLGSRLNAALASKVEELQRARSEFFGRLRKILGNRPGIRVEGDRFVFQSEVLFDTASAELGVDGLDQVRKLGATLAEISKDIPKDINWVLRVDGHTDVRPVIGGRYASNWELSTARALTVVQTLIAAGIPADRLAAAGFGEFQPLDRANNPAAWTRNRRIELRLDTR